jgi:PAS domain S-box-containing protein
VGGSKGRMVGKQRARRAPGPDNISAATTESRELLDLAQEAGRFGLFEWHVQAGTVQMSPTFLALYGLAEFDGRYDTWLKCIFREDVVRFVDEMDNAFAERAVRSQIEFRIVQPTDGALRWMEGRSRIFYDADGRAVRVVGVNVDVTERKRAVAQLRAFTESLEAAVKERTREFEAENEARRKAEDALRQAQKMEAVGQLTGGVAHDFNNLLTVVLGGLDVIGRQIPALPPSAAVSRIVRARDMALEGVQRAVTLTSRLLSFSRQQPLIPKPIDANRLIAGIYDLMRRTVGEAVSLETVTAAGLWHIHADANGLETALLNLVVNARDAMPNGGKVTIETGNAYLDDAYVRRLPEPVESGQYVMIAVADTGIGMDKATLERAFDPFFTTKDIGKGTGLGLSQVYGFVRQSEGHVRIYSELGEGTAVKIYLPRHAEGEQHPEIVAQLRETARAIGRESILVVEDDDALRGYAKEILSELGYRVLEARNGPDALDLLDKMQDIDLLFTDIVMPGGVDGRKLADEATRRRPGLKVLFTTGYTRNAIVHHGRLDPGVQLLVKPFTFGELSEKVRALLDRSA